MINLAIQIIKHIIMAMNIIQLIKDQLGPVLISKLSSELGESESGIGKAISGFLPAILGGFINQSNSSGVLDAITNVDSGSLLGDLVGGAKNNSLISSLLPLLLGGKSNDLIGNVARFAGISETSSSSVLDTVTGASLGSIGKYVKDNQLGINDIPQLLNDQKGLLAGLVPAGLSLGSLGFGNLFSSVEEKIESIKESIPNPELPKFQNNEPEKGGSIWKWLLPLIVLCLLGWFIFKQCDKKEASTPITAKGSDTLPVVDTSEAMAQLDPSQQVDIDLKGVNLKGSANGMEMQMVDFLKSGAYDKAANDETLKDKWYNFDRVNFKMGSSNELEAGSSEQLDNLVAILKAFPETKVKIGGYTDKTGNEEANLKLSQDRATFIKNYLDKAGVGNQVAGAEGYGSQYATVSAAAPDAERAKDRKMAVRFSK